MNVAELKTEATARGLNWSDVQDAFEEVQGQEMEKRSHSDLVRQSAWHLKTALEPHLSCFWRYGFAKPWKRWPKLLERDYTVIANHDVLAQEVASHFPEYTKDDGAERLFGELLTEHDPMPSRETMYAMAMGLLESSYASDGELEAVPF